MKFLRHLFKQKRTSTLHGDCSIALGISRQEITTPEHAKAIVLKANSITEKGNFEEAIKLYDSLLARSADLVNKYDVKQVRAVACCRAGRFVEAKRELEELLTVLKSDGVPIESTRTMYWYLVAKYKGDEKKAMDEFMKL